MEKFIDIFNFSNSLNNTENCSDELKKVKNNANDAIQKILNNFNKESLHKYPEMHFS